MADMPYCQVQKGRCPSENRQRPYSSILCLLAQQRQHTGLGAGTHSLIHKLAVAEHQQGGDAHHAELRGQLGLFCWTSGPHQVAQKSSRTGFVLCSTSASKFSLVMVTTAILVPSIFYPHPLRGQSVPSKEGVILTYGSSIPQTTGYFQKQSVNKKGGGPPAWGEPPPCVILWSSPGCLVRAIRP